MTLYLSFPVAMFWISNQAEYFEKYVIQRKVGKGGRTPEFRGAGSPIPAPTPVWGQAGATPAGPVFAQRHLNPFSLSWQREIYPPEDPLQVSLLLLLCNPRLASGVGACPAPEVWVEGRRGGGGCSIRWELLCSLPPGQLPF